MSCTARRAFLSVSSKYWRNHSSHTETGRPQLPSHYRSIVQGICKSNETGSMESNWWFGRPFVIALSLSRLFLLFRFSLNVLLAQAVEIDPRRVGQVPSSKGVLTQKWRGLRVIVGAFLRCINFSYLVGLIWYSMSMGNTYMRSECVKPVLPVKQLLHCPNILLLSISIKFTY